ncbi:MAG: carbohydrate ABC transporter permease, partial [Culicoidibacterales bacterium]
MKKKQKIDYAKVIIYTILIAYCLITLLPFVWTVVTSLKSQAEIAAGNTIIPDAITFDAYRTIFQSKLPLWVLNSTFVAIIVMFVNLVFNTMAGYALARMNFRGREGIFAMLMALIMVPSQVTMIPTYIIVSKLGLINTHAALILTSAISISYIFLMRQFFINFPKDIEEAASVDGLNKIQTFFYIVLPSAKPA